MTAAYCKGESDDEIHACATTHTMRNGRRKLQLIHNKDGLITKFFFWSPTHPNFLLIHHHADLSLSTCIGHDIRVYRINI